MTVYFFSFSLVGTVQCILTKHKRVLQNTCGHLDKNIKEVTIGSVILGHFFISGDALFLRLHSDPDQFHCIANVNLRSQLPNC